jgi:hypothetical protein
MVVAVAALACSQSEREDRSTGSGAFQPAGSEPALSNGPLVELVDSVYRLVLPKTMVDLLRDSIPSFKPWTIDHYSMEIRDVYLFSHREAPWAVIGDFTGDGIVDVVVDGHDEARALRLAIISQDGRYRLLVLASSLLSTSGLAGHFLAFRAPGKIGTNFSDETITLRADGFEAVHFEKAATLYYWDGIRFAEFTTAD